MSLRVITAANAQWVIEIKYNTYATVRKNEHVRRLIEELLQAGAYKKKKNAVDRFKLP